MEMVWTLCSSEIFHNTHDTEDYSSNWNERAPQTEWMIGLGRDLEIILSFYLLEFLVFKFSNIDILKKIEKKNSSLEEINEIKTISEYIYLII
jgi:hypothetical protein